MAANTVVFIAFSAEERGLIGSKYYTRNPLFPLRDTVFMLNLDMVGYYKQNGRLQFLGGSSNSTVKKVVDWVANRYPNVSTSSSSSTGGGSDHAPFISNGVPAVFMHTGLHENYHTPRDTVEKIDYAGMLPITKMAFEIVWRFAFFDEKPGRTEVNRSLDPRVWEFDHGMMPFSDPYRK